MCISRTSTTVELFFASTEREGGRKRRGGDFSHSACHLRACVCARSAPINLASPFVRATKCPCDEGPSPQFTRATEYLMPLRSLFTHPFSCKVILLLANVPITWCLAGDIRFRSESGACKCKRNNLKEECAQCLPLA